MHTGTVEIRAVCVCHRGEGAKIHGQDSINKGRTQNNHFPMQFIAVQIQGVQIKR